MMRTATALAALLAFAACAGPGSWFASGSGDAAEAVAPAGSVGSSSALTPGELDKQAGELDAIPGAEVERRDDSLLVRFPAGVLFETGEHTLQAGAHDRLRSLARTLDQHPRSRAIIKGHTDSAGNDRFNQTLSEQRADSVRKFLIAEGVAHDRITAIGFGAQMPLATNNTPEGRQQNRRIEIEIRPTQELMSQTSGEPGSPR
jgi:outer membrane protein OmpA-like peptidoglycan-associated protein